MPKIVCKYYNNKLFFNLLPFLTNNNFEGLWLQYLIINSIYIITDSGKSKSVELKRKKQNKSCNFYFSFSPLSLSPSVLFLNLNSVKLSVSPFPRQKFFFWSPAHFQTYLKGLIQTTNSYKKRQKTKNKKRQKA